MRSAHGPKVSPFSKLGSNQHANRTNTGMFLLARLIMDNLLSQDNLEDLNEELKFEVLPHGINEAYVVFNSDLQSKY